MNLPIRSPFDLLIIALLIVFSGFLIFGFAFGELSADRTRRQSKTTRLPQSVILVACALTWWLFAARGTELETFSRYVFIGMGLSFVGDVIMDDLLPVKNHATGGMIACGIGYIFYILALRELQILFSLHDKSTLVIALVASWVINAGIWAGLIFMPEGDAALNAGSLIYALLLASLIAYAVALTVQMPALAPTSVGAILFLISDTIQGNHIFRNARWHLIGDTIWTTYIFGQALIVFTTSTALTFMV